MSSRFKGTGSAGKQRNENGRDLNKNLVKNICKPSKKLERSSVVA
jgi:hypothetical protein